MKNKHVKNQQSNSWKMNLKEILNLSKQSIDINKKLQPIVNLVTTYLKPVGEANAYIIFVYGPQKICNHTQEQVLESINSHPINTNKQVNNKWH